MYYILSLLKKTSDQNVIRNQDETNMIANIAQNKIGKRLAWDYIVENWDDLYKRYLLHKKIIKLSSFKYLLISSFFLLSYGGVSFTLSRLVERVLANFNTNYELILVEKFIGERGTLGVATNSFNEAVENININIRWMNKNSNRVTNWLRKEEEERMKES